MSSQKRIPTDGGAAFGYNPFTALSTGGLPPAPANLPAAIAADVRARVERAVIHHNQPKSDDAGDDPYKDYVVPDDLTPWNAGRYTLTCSPAGATVAPWITFDLAYQYDWSEQNLLFNITMNNMFDKDPPFARTDYSYDAFTANPLGRTIKIGVTAKVN